MPVDTEDIIEKDEDLKATEQRIIELRQKKDRSPEEEKEFGDLKKHHRGRVEEQILSEREKAEAHQERAARAEQALEEARQRLQELQEQRDNRVSDTGNGESESVVINGKKFYTDEAINLRVQKGLMTQKEGWAMQRQAIIEEARAADKAEAPAEQWKRERLDALENVKKQGYGWMIDDKDPKHNPKDPLFKMAQRLWEGGYKNEAKGPLKALEDAKEILGLNLKRQDMSDEFSIPKNNSASDSATQREKRVELSEIETSNAIRYWPTVTNPKTGKYYTEAEALVKALEAKRKRNIK
jgi:hypothetical protein